MSMKVIFNSEKLVSNPQPCESDPATESWRGAVETQLIQYVSDHYPHGVCAVYARTQGSAVTLTMCIEDHQFQPKNYWYVHSSVNDKFSLSERVSLLQHVYQYVNDQLIYIGTSIRSCAWIR